MILEESTLQAAYVVSVVTSIGLCVILWRHREKTGAIPLLCYVFSGLLWGGTQLVSVTIDDYAISVALHRFLYLGIALGVASLFVFALEYTGRERYLRPRTYLALSIHLIFVVVFAIVDPGGHFIETIEPAPSTALGIAPEYGIAMLVHLVYAYVLVVASALMFVGMLYRSRSLYRGQSLALIGGAVLPACGPLAVILGVVTFDPTPLVIPVASGLFTIAIVRYRLIDLVPIARDRVLDTVNDGIFVIDENDRLVDLNPEGRRILRAVGVDDGSFVGRHVPSLLEDYDVPCEHEAITGTREQTTTEVSIATTYFEITTTPIDDGRHRHVGWLAIAHDVTERKRREDELERQNERLEQFADLVSHDLRNPLTVASGYLELARETDDERYLEEVERAHERMETIIDDVLTLAREGADVTDPRPVELATLAERAWNGVETGDATIEVRSSASILADPDRVRRLLENLFRNAVEHGSTSPDSHARQDAVEHGSPNPASQAQQDAVEHGSTSPGSQARQDAVEHGSTNPASQAQQDAVEHGSANVDETAVGVTVGIDREGFPGGTTFYVEDDGDGIPPDLRERVFEGGYTTGAEGTGLGLSIVQQIAEAHGWSVRAAEGETGGARFEFTGVEHDVDSGPNVDESTSTSETPDSPSRRS